MYRVKFVFLMKSMQGEDTRRWMTHGGSGDMTDFHDKGLLSQRTESIQPKQHFIPQVPLSATMMSLYLIMC